MPAWTDGDYKRMGMTPPGKDKPKKKKGETILTADSPMPEIEEEKLRRRKVLTRLGIK